MPPDQITTLSTSNSGTDVIIDWEAPSNNGDEITGYTITIQQGDGTYSEDSVYCDGSQADIK